MTEQLIHHDLILEQFPTAQRLYQYLNWTMRMSKVAQVLSLWTFPLNFCENPKSRKFENL